MASSPSTPQKRSPQVPRLHLKSFSSDPGNNSPCLTPQSTTSWMDRRHSLLQSITQHNFVPAYDPVHLSDIIFKLIQLIVTIVCTGSYSEGVKQVTSSTTAQMMPYFVCSAYLIIIPVILISYTLGHQMPEILTRIFNAVGGILSLAAGIFALHNWREHTKIDCQPLEEIAEKERIMLLNTGVLCLVNSMLYLLDLSCSIYRSLIPHESKTPLIRN